jgi:O-antigen/teichoic acid export membrane protein
LVEKQFGNKHLKIQNFLKSSILPKSLIAAVDQATLSGLSFLISIILIKHVPKVEYGYYSIGFAILLFVVSVQQAIVSTPLAVLLVEKKDQEKKWYAGSLCYGQFIIIIPVVCLGLAATALLSYGRLNSTQTWVSASVCFAVIGLILREYLRSYLYAEEQPLEAFKIDAVYIFLVLSLIIPIYLFFTISVPAIFVITGINGIVIGLFFGRKQGWYYNKDSVRKSYSENWRYGKWALFGGFVTYISNYSYLYLLGALLGSSSIAEVQAARLLIMPMVLFRAGWMCIAVPHGSKLRELGQIKRFFKQQVIVCLIWMLIMAFYAVFLMSFAELLKNFLFTQKYLNSLDYFLYWVVVNIIGFVGSSASFGMQVTKKFDILSKINFLTMIVTLGSAFILISTFGIVGALTAQIIGASFSAAVQWFYFFKEVFLKKSVGIEFSASEVLRSKPLKSESYKTG